MREEEDGRKELRAQSLISVYHNSPFRTTLPAFRIVSLIVYSGNRYYIARRDIMSNARCTLMLYIDEKRGKAGGMWG